MNVQCQAEFLAHSRYQQTADIAGTDPLLRVLLVWVGFLIDFIGVSRQHHHVN